MRLSTGAGLPAPSVAWLGTTLWESRSCLWSPVDKSRPQAFPPPFSACGGVAGPGGVWTSGRLVPPAESIARTSPRRPDSSEDWRRRPAVEDAQGASDRPGRLACDLHGGRLAELVGSRRWLTALDGLRRGLGSELASGAASRRRSGISRAAGSDSLSALPAGGGPIGCRFKLCPFGQCGRIDGSSARWRRAALTPRHVCLNPETLGQGWSPAGRAAEGVTKGRAGPRAVARDGAVGDRLARTSDFRCFV
jgi:hypothetical protein